jgi:hypothetical protein
VSADRKAKMKKQEERDRRQRAKWLQTYERILPLVGARDLFQRSRLLCAHGGSGPTPLWFGVDGRAWMMREARAGDVSTALGHVGWHLLASNQPSVSAPPCRLAVGHRVAD